MFEAVDTLIAEHAELEQRLGDPAVHSDQRLARTLGQRHAELSAIVRTYRDWQQATDDREAAIELDMTDEAAELETSIAELGEKLRQLLVPRDPADSKDVIMDDYGVRRVW